jgi:monoamine oxidase
MRRRDWLKGVAAAIAGLQRLPRRAIAGARGKKVIVIGAGIAGLAAGQELKRRGFEVTVIEARERLGGRLWTDRSLGAPVELGASWLEQYELNPLKPLAEKFKLSQTLCDLESTALYDRKGVRLPQDRVEELFEQLYDLMEDAESMASRVDHDLSLGEAIRRRLNRLRPNALQQRELDWALWTQVWEYAAELDQLSLQHFDPEAGSQEEEPEDMTVVGFDRLLGHCAEGLEIRLGAKATRVEYGGASVQVSAEDRQRQADYALIAVPLGVLKSGAIEFDPPLPARKQEAIDQLGMGVTNKLVLRYPRAFWPAEPQFLGYVPREGNGFRLFMNLHTDSGRPLLAAISAGEQAQRLERLSDREQIAAAQQTLRGMFGDRIPEPESHQVTRWGADPYSLGAYSYVPVGRNGDDHDALAEPVGQRLLFAGEATHRRWPTTVHGAWLSGLREAERLSRWVSGA